MDVALWFAEIWLRTWEASTLAPIPANSLSSSLCSCFSKSQTCSHQERSTTNSTFSLESLTTGSSSPSGFSLLPFRLSSPCMQESFLKYTQKVWPGNSGSKPCWLPPLNSFAISSWNSFLTELPLLWELTPCLTSAKLLQEDLAALPLTLMTKTPKKKNEKRLKIWTTTLKTWKSQEVP